MECHPSYPQPNRNMLKADPTSLNKFFNETVEQLVRNDPAHNVVIMDIDLLKDNTSCFKL